MSVREAMLAVLAGGGLAGLPAPAAARQTVPISSEPGTCVIELREVVQLGDLSDPGTIGLRPEITRTGAGEFVVASVENRGELLVYDAEGRFRRTFGGAGEGPGEYRAPGRVRLGSEGSLLILDILNRRITRATDGGGVLQTVDVRALQALDFLAPAAEDRFVLSGFGGGAGGLTTALDVLDSGGETLARLGSEPIERWVVNFFRAPLALDVRGRVWAPEAGAYAFRAWDTGGGDAVSRLAGEADWFDPGPPRPGAPITAPTPSVVMSLRFAGELMWIVTWIADANWEDNADMSRADLQLTRVLDSMIEVVDPESGALLARMRHPEALRITGDEGFVFGVREDDVVPRAVLYEPSLAGPDCPSGAGPGR